MNYRFDYVCKLITNLKKTKNINIDINIDNLEFTNTDIRYLILTILMNSGLLFEKKFSDINWIIDRNDFSAFCNWHGLDGTYSNIAEDPFTGEDLWGDIIDWSFLDEKSYEEPIIVDCYDQGDEYILSIFKDDEGNVSGSKVMNQIRNKLCHNQFNEFKDSIILKFAEGVLEIEDKDIYVILESYLKTFINNKIIKQLLYCDGFMNGNYSSEEKIDPNPVDVLKFKEITDMFDFLFFNVYCNSNLDSYSKLQEALLPFNNILNSINELNPFSLKLSQPDYEKAQLSSLFSVIFVMSDLSQIDLLSLDFNFMTISNEYSKSNDNIIRHIRNSFAHGYFVYQGDNIIIEDYNTNKAKTFSAVCSINDFMNFSLSENILYKIYNIPHNPSIRK